jgi:hypothetical protein
METPNYLKEIILNPCFLAVLFTFQIWSDPAVAQDIALGADGSSSLSYGDLSIGSSASMNEVYPECPEPAGTLRFVYDDHEIIRFMEAPKEGKFYYVIQLVYTQGQHESLTREVRDMKQFEIDYSRDEVPDEILVKRVCHLLEAPFIYHSDWVSVPTVQSSRTVGDSICADFNGAEVLYNPMDSSYTIVSSWENRSWTNYSFRFALNITYCTEEDTTIFITDFPFVLTNNGVICAMTLTMQYQGFSVQWYDCDEFNIFESDPNAPVITFCDGNHPEIEIQDSVLITTLDGEESFFIAGFEVTILKLTGDLTGIGVLTLPFQNKSLLINFTNLNINEDLQVVSLGGGSSITAVVNGSVESPDGSLSLGGEMCIPPEESEWDGDTNKLTGELWDPNGFGKDGQYIKMPPYDGYQEGDPYDPNFDPCGFDVNGYYLDSGEKCNPEGCSRDSVTCDTPAQPCELDCAPYFWLQENDPTAAGIIFYDSISGGLPGKVDSLIELIQTEYESLKILTQDSCFALASDMRGVVLSEQLDSISIFGETSQYINPGLSTKFVSTPEKSSIRNQRNPNIVELEDLHVDLFHCDDRTLKLEAILEFIDSIGHDNPALLSFLETKIKAFTADSVAKYTDPQAWIMKLRSLIAQFLEQNYDGVDFGYWNPELENSTFKEIAPSGEHPKFILRDRSNFISLLGLAGYQTFQKILSEEVFPNFGGVEGGTLPMEITLPIEGELVKIIITQIGFGPTYFTVDAYLIINLPNGGEQLIFKCSDVKFSPNGFIDAPKLSLESDVRVKLFNVASLVLESDSTFVKWNCDGFEALSISGYIEFCNNILLPLDSLTEEPLVNSEEKVKAFFQTSITKLDGFWADLTVEPFAVAGVENVRFTITGAVLDMSTTRSPEVLFPIGYTNEHVQLNLDGIPYPTQPWKGFYLGHLGVEIIGGDLFSDSEISVDMYHAVIDDRGFSGKVNIGTGILDIEDGNIGGWACSIDSFQIHFLFNHLRGAGFSGLIHVPIFKADCGGSIVDFEIEEEDCFEYGAQFVNGDEIQLSISPRSQMCVPLWSAKMVLDSNTVVNLRKSPDDFFLEAILYGEIDFDNPTATVQDTVRFENVRLRNKAPYFSIGNWDIPDIPVGIGPFKLTMNQIKLDSVPNTDSKIRLSFVGGLELEDGAFKIAAEASLSIYGDLAISNGRQRWVYDTTEVHGIRVESDIKGTHIEGGLRFFDGDNEYGKGFAGYLYTKFSDLGVTALAKGIFGKKDDFNYFSVDALATIPEGIPIVWPMILNGLGGGLSYNMAIADIMEHLPNDFGIPNDTNSIFSMPLGVSLSGMEYVPNDSSNDLNVRLIVAGTIGDSIICSFNAIFEMRFLQLVPVGTSLTGTVRMMDGISIDDIPGFPAVDRVLDKIISKTRLINWEPPSIEAPVKGYFSINFSGERNPVVDGMLAIYAEAGPENNRIIYGRALAELHIDNKEWYFNLGRLNNDPEGRAELTLDLAILTTQVKAYLNIGTGIPPVPEPPRQIKELFGNVASPDASLGFGTGFAFGASVDVKLNIPILIGAVKFNAGYGFDLSLKQYENAVCANTGSDIGINGWYSTGQAYMYVNGSVELFGAKLIDIATGALLQAGFPNPTWVSGQLKLRYKLLGVKGSLNAKVKFGSQCIPEGEEGSELPPVIASVIPMNASSKVNVLSSINVEFNLPMDVSEEYKDGDTVIVYKTEIDTIKLISGIGGEIPLVLNFDDEKKQLELLPLYTLPSGDSLTFKVRVRVFKNNVELDELDGLERIIGFKTEGGITTIPLSNISSTYPLDGMNNFYRDEYQDNLGYINLVRNQYDLYHLPAGKHLAVVLSSPTQKFIGAATYNVNAKRIDFPLPKSIIEHNQFYKIELGLTSIDITASGGNLVSISEGDYGKFSNLWSATFRVSSFESLFDKIAEMTASMDLNVSLSEAEFFDHCTALPIFISEPFDKAEIIPNPNPILRDLLNETSLIEIKLDIETMATHADYDTVWTWVDYVLKQYSDPFIDFFSYFFQQPARDRYEGLYESVFIGPDCNHDPDILHPEITSQQFAALEGYAEMESNVDPSMIDDIGSLSGGELDPHDESLAAKQFLVINVNKYIKNLFLTGKSNASRAVTLAVDRCLEEIANSQGRSLRDAPQDCDEKELVGSSIYQIAFNPAEEPWFLFEGDSTIKIPIIITYTLPGTNHVTSTHSIIYTYTIE